MPQSRKFSGLISKCAMPWAWQYATAWAACQAKLSRRSWVSTCLRKGSKSQDLKAYRASDAMNIPRWC